MPRTLRYEAQMQAGGQTVDVTVVRSLTEVHPEGVPTWLLADAVTLPAGAVTDSLWLDRATFRPRRRVVHQGPAGIVLSYAPERVTGEVAMPGRTVPYDLALEAPIAVDGASLEAALGALPLAAGYRATFAGLDLTAQRALGFTVEVTGTETVTTPAGPFDAGVVRLTKGAGDAGGDGTLWVDRASGVVVQSETTRPPQAGGGAAVIRRAAME